MLRVAIILLAGLFVAAPAFNGTWLWDDDQEITANGALTSLAGLKAIWGGNAGADWLPLKSTILWIEWHLWEYDNTCYHIANTLFHLLDALLVWRLFSLLRIRWAWVGGLLFAIHPILMESVGWVSEQKNTIALALMLPALCAYIQFDEAREEGGKWRYYCIALGCFVASLLCKSAGVMLPFLLLLYDWWKHDKLRPRDILLIGAMGCALGFLFVGGLALETGLRGKPVPWMKYVAAGLLSGALAPALGLLWWQVKGGAGGSGVPPLSEKQSGRMSLPLSVAAAASDTEPVWRHAWRLVLTSLPFFIVSVVISVVTVHFQLKNAIGAEGIPVGGPLSRAAVAGASVWFYLWKCVWPFDLLPIYPKWELGKLGMVDGKWAELAPPEWWQLIIPWVALLAGFLVIWVACRSNWRRALRLGAGFILGSLAVILCFALLSGAGVAWEQFKFLRWKISVPAVFLVLWVIAGVGLVFRESIKIPKKSPRSPSFARPLLLSLGFFLINLVPVMGFMTMSYMRITWAADHFVYISVIGIIGLAVAGAAWVHERATPDWKPWVLAAVTLAAVRVCVAAHLYCGIFAGEAPMWQHTMRGNNDAWQAHSRYGKVMLDTGKFDAAFYHISQSNRLRPDLAETNNNMGVLLLQKKRVAEAINYFRIAAETMPMPAFMINYANALANSGRGAEAVPVYEKVLKDNPNNPIVQCNYGVALAQAGRRESAIAAFELALKLNPNMPDAKRNLDALLSSATAAPQTAGTIAPVLGSPAQIPTQPGVDMGQIPEIFRPQTTSTRHAK
jgi:Tfp pilus assembly protein PilF